MESFDNIHALFKQIKRLESEINGLRSMMLKIEDLEKENNLLRKEMILLSEENAALKEKLAKYEHPKNSNNSSIPPSKDENRPRKSKRLRKKTGHTPGGQKGHEGTTLEMTDHPDQTIDHAPRYCEYCGKDIGAVPVEFVGLRQEIDIPPITPIVTEHRIYRKQCRYCVGTRLLEESFSGRCENPPALYCSSAQRTDLFGRKIPSSMARQVQKVDP